MDDNFIDELLEAICDGTFDDIDWEVEDEDELLKETDCDFWDMVCDIWENPSDFETTRR